MKRKIGLWVDHEKAVIVCLEGESVTVREVPSEVQRYSRLAGGAPLSAPYGPQDVTSEKKRQRHHDRELQDFYKRLIEMIRDADSILIMGPGEAKTELKKAVAKRKNLGGKIFAVSPADKMSRRQIVAKVQERFGEQSGTRE